MVDVRHSRRNIAKIVREATVDAELHVPVLIGYGLHCEIIEETVEVIRAPLSSVWLGEKYLRSSSGFHPKLRQLSHQGTGNLF